MIGLDVLLVLPQVGIEPLTEMTLVVEQADADERDSEIRRALQMPILSSVQTYLLDNPADRSYVLANLESLVVKAVGESGGYGNDPLVALRRLMGEMYARFAYSPRSTRVDSPIDEALETRKGVCQDFAHIFLSLVRPLGIPARYVSGYLFQPAGSQNRSTDGATHAWVEVLLPDLGWVGLDPTNNLIANDRHIRVAIGRDYADVPPTRGVFKGVSSVRSELSVSVTVGPALSPLSNDLTPFTPWMARESVEPAVVDSEQQQQQ